MGGSAVKVRTARFAPFWQLGVLCLRVTVTIGVSPVLFAPSLVILLLRFSTNLELDSPTLGLLLLLSL